MNGETVMIKEKTIPVMIKEIDEETPQIKRFTLAPVDDIKLPLFSGGSHIITYIEVENDFIIRPYSLTSHPFQSASYQIAIRLSDTSKGGSLFWHQQLKIGDKLRISYPKNYFPLSHRAKHHVFYAAGIGITPFLTMMAELRVNGISFELHYAAKSEELCAFYSYIQENYKDQSHLYFSTQQSRLSTESLQHHLIGTHVYFCGPESFISTFTDTAQQLGYPSSSIHIERFAPVQPKHLTSFEVKIKNGTSIHVLKEKSLLDALLEKGIKASYSCKVGRCGTCELKVAEGKIDHYDSFLTEEQRNTHKIILPCVSRAKSDRLVLEI